MKNGAIIHTSVPGPATVMGDDGEVLVGIIQGGIKDCNKAQCYTMLASVYANINWIRKRMNNN